MIPTEKIREALLVIRSRTFGSTTFLCRDIYSMATDALALLEEEGRKGEGHDQGDAAEDSGPGQRSNLSAEPERISAHVPIAPAHEPTAKIIEDLENALQLILPMAKGYAGSVPVGSNARYLDIADTALLNLGDMRSRLATNPDPL